MLASSATIRGKVLLRNRVNRHIPSLCIPYINDSIATSVNTQSIKMRFHDITDVTDPELWSKVDDYFVEKLCPNDNALENALKNNAEKGLPNIDVSATQGKLLNLYVKMTGAKRVLEVGTLGGYSSIWMARALPEGGKLATIEYEKHNAEVAKDNIEKAGLSHVIDIHIGAALDVIPTLEGPFDFVFLDADKKNNPNYLELVLKLSKPGTIIVCDNVVRNGTLLDPETSDERVAGSRKFVEAVSANPHLEATGVETVGEKGWDGYVIARVI